MTVEMDIPWCENCLKSLDDPTRQECGVCGNVFDLKNLLFEPPEFDGVCDECFEDILEEATDNERRHI